MEFFERAHVLNSQRKESKHEKNRKQQLKRMLLGYKHTDNELIKKSADSKNEYDDNISENEVSDLNLSYVSEAVGTALDSPVLDDEPRNISPIGSDCTVDNAESVVNSEGNSSDISTDNSNLDTVKDSEPFDADGALASKIIEKLNLAKNLPKNSKKRKLNDYVETSDSSSFENEYVEPIKKLKNKDKKVGKEVDDCYETNTVKKKDKTKDATNVCMYKDPFGPKVLHISDQMSKDESSTSSSQFVSIKVADEPSENLDDIVGEYKYSTSKNLPSDFVHSAPIDMFKEENMSLVTTREEYSSSTTHNDCDGGNTDLTTDNNQSLSESEDDVNYSDEETESNGRKQSIEEIDKLIDTIKVYNGKKNCIFIMKHPAKIYIHGKVCVRALTGSVEILGYALRSLPCNVYAVNNNYAQCLKTVEGNTVQQGLFGKLTSVGLSSRDAHDILTALEKHDSVVSLSPLRCNKMDFVENNFTASDLFSKVNRNVEGIFKKSSEILGCTLYLRKPAKNFEVHSTWKYAVRCGMISENSRGLVCGGKGMGKSTFLRYYVNKQLVQGPVLVLDLDPGQCEFTVAGNLSATVVNEPLIGPAFTHLKKPELMLNIGMITPMDNPRRYAAAVHALIDHCNSTTRLRNMPWIVNTMGMCNNMGLKFITLIILKTKPTFLLQIDSKNAKRRFDFQLYAQTVKNLYFEDYQSDPLFKNVPEPNLDYTFIISLHTDRMETSNYTFAPRDERYLNFLAYFSELLTEKRDILDIRPFEVNLNGLSIVVNVKIDRGSVMNVINGKVVALCQHRQHPAPVFTLGDTPLICHGHGLIRGIDSESQMLYVITPIPMSKLPLVDCVLYADWVPELRGTERGLPTGTPVPYRTAAAYEQRQLMFAPKRRFNPLQLLKMTRSNLN